MINSAKILRLASAGFKLKPRISTGTKIIARNAGSITTWNKDWKPGPYPKTEEQRLAAAKKYNMIPEDYKPYPEEEGMGDYPMFPMYHMESRTDHEPYDIPHLKMNFGEPVHPRYDVCVEDKVNWQNQHRYGWTRQVCIVFGVFLAFSGLIYLDRKYPYEVNRMPKQYPRHGKTFYTFEPAQQEAEQ